MANSKVYGSIKWQSSSKLNFVLRFKDNRQKIYKKKNFFNKRLNLNTPPY